MARLKRLKMALALLCGSWVRAPACAVFTYTYYKKVQGHSDRRTLAQSLQPAGQACSLSSSGTLVFFRITA